MVGARPAGVGVLPGQEGGQLARRDPRVVAGGLGRGRAAQPLADRRELLVGQLQQPGRQGEPAVELARVLGRDRALVADVVLELGPGVLQHGAELHLHDPALDLHLQVPAGVAEPALAGGQLPEVAVVEHRQLLGEQRGHGLDVVADVGDHPDAELVADVAQRVGVERPSGLGPGRLLGERRDALARPVDGQVVDAGLVEDRGQQRHRSRAAAATSAGCCSAYAVTASRGRVVPGGPRRGLPERGGDDDARLGVAVRGDPVGRAGRRTARRRRRRTASTWSSATRSWLLRVAPSTARPQRRPGLVGRDDPVSTRPISRSSSTAERQVAAVLGLVLQRLVEAEQRDRRRVRVDLERRSRGAPARAAWQTRAPRVPLGELRLAGVGGVGAGLEAAEVPAQRLLGRAGPGRVGDDEGRVDPGHAPSAPRYGARAPPISSSVRTAARWSSRASASRTARPVGCFCPHARSMPR